MRILILEDGSWVADELSRMLRRQGCAVEVARSSEQAVRNTAAQSLDLLILDLSLRVIDGPRLLRALEEQRDRVPPLLVLTSVGIAEIVARFMRGARGVTTAAVIALVAWHNVHYALDHAIFGFRESERKRDRRSRVSHRVECCR